MSPVKSVTYLSDRTDISLKAECRKMFQIGEWRMLSAD
jgi:hypothetical protein